MAYIFLLFSNNLISTTPNTKPANPWTMFEGILSNDEEKPYKKPSKVKYPKIIKSSELVPLKTLISVPFLFLLTKLAKIAISPFITNVVGAYTMYPENISARAEPKPAAKKP